MKTNFKKAVLLCTAMATSIGSYAISTGGAVAAGLGAAAAVSLIGVGVHKHRKHKCERSGYEGRKCQKYLEKEERRKKSGKSNKHHHHHNDEYHTNKHMKKDLRHEKNAKQAELSTHRKGLKKLERHGKGTTQEATEKRSMIQTLEADISEIEMKLKNL
jgi:hypothetical protein